MGGEPHRDGRCCEGPAASDPALIRLRRQLAERTAENVELRQRLDEAESRHRTMLGSTSWRLTAPLRAVSRLMAGRTAARTGAVQGPLDFGDRDYGVWFGRYMALDRADRAAIHDHIAAMAPAPHLGLVLAVGDEPAAGIEEMIASLRGQLYRSWELWIADGSRLPGTARMLASAAADPRIRLLRVPVEDGRVRGLNAVLALAGGSHVAVLPPSGRLAEQALYEVAACLHADAGPDLVFGDDDEIDGLGRHRRPRFKGGWSPELLLAQDYLGGGAFFRLARVRDAGGLREEAGEDAVYDLALRLTAGGASCRAVHLPVVLHSARARSPATDAATASRRRSVRDRLAAEGLTADVAPVPFGCRATWTPSAWPSVTVIVPTRDRAELLARCVDGVLRRTDYPDVEVVVVDNDSREPRTHALLARLGTDGRTRVLPFPGPFNWSAMNNLAARHARGDLLVFLNNDIEIVRPDWLRELARHALRPGVGAVGAKLLFADGTVQHAGLWLGPADRARHLLRLSPGADPGYLGQMSLVRNLSAVTGACLAIRRAIFAEAGGFDEALPVAHNDVDFCLRLQAAGHRIVWTPHAELLHLESASRGVDGGPERRDAVAAERTALRRRWGARLDVDPHFNPNLDLVGEERLVLACPPRRPKRWSRTDDPRSRADAEAPE